MGIAARLRRNKLGVASAAGVTVFALVVAGMAISSQGYATAEVELNNSGVWVTNSALHLVGRFNTSAGALDGAVRSNGASIDVLQHQSTVVAQDRTTGTLAQVSSEWVTATQPTQLPNGATPLIGGSTLAVLDRSGSVWTISGDAVGSFDPKAKPVVTAGKGAAVAVSGAGTVFVASASHHKLYTVTTSAGHATATVTTELAGVGATSKVAVTAVGEKPVVLNRSTGALILPGKDGKNKPVSVAVPGANKATLQQPGSEDDVVWYETADSLISQPLDGSPSANVSAGGAGTSAAPAVVAGCTYAIWAVSGRYLRSCNGTVTRDAIKNLSPTASLVFRVNRDRVVLNDSMSGGVWLTSQDKLVKIDNWQSAIAKEDKNGETGDAEQNKPQQLASHDKSKNKPPVANDDHYGVRPGRTTILPVLDNDTDPDGDVLTAEVVGKGPAFGDLQSVYGNTAMQLTVPDDATGSTSFRYSAEDGLGGSATATVTINVRPWSVNAAPTQERVQSVLLDQGGSGRLNVLPDWHDPDGDPISLAGASTTTTGDQVHFTADGTLIFQDAGLSTGRKVVRLTVSDGKLTTDGQVIFDVRAGKNLPPVTVSDHAVTVVNKPVTIAPLANDSDPAGGALQLSSVGKAAGATITPDLTNGTVTVEAASAGTYNIIYAAANDAGVTSGLLRVDVEAPNTGDTPVAVADVALLPAGGEVMCDVLANDEDPSGGILVVQSLTLPQPSPVAVQTIDHNVLKISEVRGLTEPYQFTYTASNGAKAATGQVTVIPQPAVAQLQPPVATDDTATVRAGDIVTIPVLANDVSPDNAPLKLVPKLVETPPADAGLIFTSANTVRFKAGDGAGTFHAVYQVTDGQNLASAQITINVKAKDPAHNSPPIPKSVTARTIAGSQARITIPLDGIDPDGDFVSLVGQGSAPAKGQVTNVGADWIDYTANQGTSGTDTFTYVVQDRLGAQATAAIRVGIAPPPSTNQPPIAADDSVTVRPGRAVSVDVLKNDSDPEGGPLKLVADGLSSSTINPRILGKRVAFTAPAKPGVYTIYYTVADQFDARARAAITVTVDPKAPLLAPIARDDTVGLADIAGKSTITVPVLANDEDPDGSVSDLKVSISDQQGPGPDQQVTVTADNQVKVKITQSLQIIPYVDTDIDHLTGKAFIIVPGITERKPVINPSARLVTVKSGESVVIRLGDQILEPNGAPLRITSSDKVSAQNGQVKVDSATSLTFSANKDYSGPASVTLEVTDGTGPDDPKGAKALVTVPINVLPVEEENKPPTWTSPSVKVTAGEKASVDLSKFASDPDPADQGKLVFALGGNGGQGVTASLHGSVVTVSAATTAKKGTTLSIPISAKDSKNPAVNSTLSVTVVGSTMPLAHCNDDVVSDAHQGETVRVPVLANDTNPFSKPLTLLSATVETGIGTAEVTGSQVAVTPGKSFVGTMVVRYRVADETGDPDRQVDGRIRLTVKGKPAAPATPTVNEVRSHTVVLSWTPPVNNGAPITGYEVGWSGGTKKCEATTCTIDSLTNNVEYSFTVTATNEVGSSDPSAPSAAIRPDAQPDTPAAPTLTFGDHQITINWTTPNTDGSPVTSYDLRLSGGDQAGQRSEITGNSYVWAGLTNGVAYRVQVLAHNKAPQPSDWSPMSAPEIPAGVPAAPATPTVQRIAPVGNQTQLRVSWNQPDGNGDAVKSYVLHVYRGGSEIRSVTVDGGSNTSQAITADNNSTAYTFAVDTTNKAGKSAASGQSSAIRAFGKPGTVSGLTATDKDNAATISFSPASGNGAMTSEIVYNWTATRVGGSGNASASGSCGSSTSCTVSGISNNGTYQIAVTAVASADGMSYTGDPATVGDVKPYGAIKDASLLGLSWQQNGIHGTFNWNGNANILMNGRPIAKAVVSVNGNQPPFTNGVVQVGTGPNQPFSTTIQVCDTAGSCTSVTKAGSTASPSVELRRGPEKNGREVPILHYDYHNFPQNASVVCHWFIDPAQAFPGVTPGDQLSTTQSDGNGNGSGTFNTMGSAYEEQIYCVSGSIHVDSNKS